MTTTARRCPSPGSRGGRAGPPYAARPPQAASLIGHLNLTHPNCIQVIGAYEAGIVGGFVDSAFSNRNPPR